MVWGKEGCCHYNVYLFNVHVDEFSEVLNTLHVGCHYNGMLINYLLYADDMIVMAPSASGLQSLLYKCGQILSS